MQQQIQTALTLIDPYLKHLKRKFDSLVAPAVLQLRCGRRKRNRGEQEQAGKSKRRRTNIGIVIRESESGNKVNPFPESPGNSKPNHQSREDVLEHERSLKKPMVYVEKAGAKKVKFRPVLGEVSKIVRLDNGVVISEPGSSKDPFPIKSLGMGGMYNMDVDDDGKI